MNIHLACHFRPKEIADLQEIKIDDERVRAWHKENCRCAKEKPPVGFWGYDFWCEYWSYTDEEWRGIAHTVGMQADQERRRGNEDLARAREEVQASILARLES